MISYKQAEANRRNALQSTGPKTTRGIETAGFNALDPALWPVNRRNRLVPGRHSLEPESPRLQSCNGLTSVDGPTDPSGGVAIEASTSRASVAGRRSRRSARPRNPGGRPCKMSTSPALAVVSALCQGQSLDEAARSAGVGPSTLYRWLAAGRRGDPRYSALVEA